MGIPPDEEVADRGQHDALRIKASKLPTRRPWEYLGPLFVPVNPQRIGAPICLDQHLPTRTFIRSSPYSERSTSYRGPSSPRVRKWSTIRDFSRTIRHNLFLARQIWLGLFGLRSICRPWCSTFGHAFTNIWMLRREHSQTRSSLRIKLLCASKYVLVVAAPTPESIYLLKPFVGKLLIAGRRMSISIETIIASLSKVRASDQLNFSINADELVLEKLEDHIVEKKVQLPLRWLRGLAAATS